MKDLAKPMALPELEAALKARGGAFFAQDLALPGLLHGALLLSPLAHARLKGLDLAKAQALAGVKALLSAGQAPGLLSQGQVDYLGQPLAAVAAISLDIAHKACGLVKADLEELPAAPASLETLAGQDLAAGPLLSQGDAPGVLAQADLKVQAKFSLPSLPAIWPLAPAALAAPDLGGGLVLWCQSPAPQATQHLLAQALGLAPGQVRVIALGCPAGQEEAWLTPWQLAAAHLALATGRPVRLLPSPAEQALLGGRRAGMLVRAQAGFSAQGQLVALDLEALLETGPGLLAGGLGPDWGLLPYRCPNLRCQARLAASNLPPALGPGNAALLLALEGLLDLAAQSLGQDPLELRLTNALKPGDTLSLGGQAGPCRLRQCLEQAAQASGWHSRRESLAPGQGLGMAPAVQLSGALRPGQDAGQAFAVVEARLEPGGGAHLLTQASLGPQGSLDALRRILAAELGLDPARVRLTSGDSALAPACGLAAQGSQLARLSALATARAGAQLRQMQAQAQPEGPPLSALGLARAQELAQGPLELACGALALETSLDALTGQVRVLGLWACQDCGQVISPLALAGQQAQAVQEGLRLALGQVPHLEGPDLTLAGLPLPTTLDLGAWQTQTLEGQDAQGPAEAGLGLAGALPPALAQALAQAGGQLPLVSPLSPMAVLQTLGRLRG